MIDRIALVAAILLVSAACGDGRNGRDRETPATDAAPVDAMVDGRAYVSLYGAAWSSASNAGEPTGGYVLVHDEVGDLVSERYVEGSAELPIVDGGSVSFISANEVITVFEVQSGEHITFGHPAGTTAALPEGSAIQLGSEVVGADSYDLRVGGGVYDILLGSPRSLEDAWAYSVGDEVLAFALAESQGSPIPLAWSAARFGGADFATTPTMPSWTMSQPASSLTLEAAPVASTDVWSSFKMGLTGEIVEIAPVSAGGSTTVQVWAPVHEAARVNLRVTVSSGGRLELGIPVARADEFDVVDGMQDLLPRLHGYTLDLSEPERPRVRWSADAPHDDADLAVARVVSRSTKNWTGYGRAPLTSMRVPELPEKWQLPTSRSDYLLPEEASEWETYVAVIDHDSIFDYTEARSRGNFGDTFPYKSVGFSVSGGVTGAVRRASYLTGQ